MTFRAGRLRHRVTLQSMTTAQDPVTGEMVPAWSAWLTDEPAEFVPLSAREFIAAAATQVAADARATIRYRAGVTSAMRLVHDGATYNVGSVLADNKSGREWLTLLVSSKNDGT